MKAIISHDIDHLTVSEHLLRDLIVPKALVRNHLEWASGQISRREYFLRWREIFQNKWNNIESLIAFNQSKKIPSSFFIGTRRGYGLSYSTHASKLWANHIINSGCELNLHGIANDNQAEISNELNLFREMSGQQHSGIRLHYVRLIDDTLIKLASAGHSFDSSRFALENPYQIENMWEFPFQIMDSWILENGRKRQTRNLHQAIAATQTLVEQALKLNLDYLTIIFHDRYYSESFHTWKHWYHWLIEYLESCNISFINFEEAIAELESKKMK